MASWLLRRIIVSALTILGMVTLVFFLVRLGGDPTVLYLPEDATEADVAAYRQRMGFDRPLAVQYADFMWTFVSRGDLGESFQYGQPALPVVLERLPATAKLAAVAFVIAMAVAIPVGIISAVYRNSLLDAVARIFALLGQCLPVFWFGLLLIILFAVRFPILPSSGYGEFKYLILPGITLGMYSMAVTMRVLRSSMIEVLANDYVRTARAKGLADTAVVLRHALKNASLPVITVIGLRVGYLLSGAVLTETVFAFPGMGRLAVQAIYERDFAIVQAFVVVVGVLMILITLLTDILYTYLDPRISYR